MRQLLVWSGETRQYVGEYVFSNEKFTRDLNSRASSTIDVFDPDEKITELDTFYIPHYLEKQEYSITGRITEVKRDSSSQLTTLTFFYGMDTYDVPVFIYNDDKIKNWDYVTNNWNQNLAFWIKTKDTVQQMSNNLNGQDSQTQLPEGYKQEEQLNNNVITADTAARQVARKSPKKEVMKKWDIYVTDYDQDKEDDTKWYLRLDDPEIFNVKLSFDKTKFNILTLYPSWVPTDKNYPMTRTFYLKKNGAVTEGMRDFNEQITDRAVTEQIESVGVDNYDGDDGLNYAIDKLHAQEYNNEISFGVRTDTQIKCLQMNEHFLGRKLTVWTLHNNQIPTIISKYEMTSPEYIQITLGLARTKLTDKLKSESK